MQSPQTVNPELCHLTSEHRKSVIFCSFRAFFSRAFKSRGFRRTSPSSSSSSSLQLLRLLFFFLLSFLFSSLLLSLSNSESVGLTGSPVKNSRYDTIDTSLSVQSLHTHGNQYSLLELSSSEDSSRCQGAPRGSFGGWYGSSSSSS